MYGGMRQDTDILQRHERRIQISVRYMPNKFVILQYSIE